MPGFDPILDGTASPFVEFKVVRYEDDLWEITTPDGEVLIAKDFDAMRTAVVAWLKGHGYP